MKNIVTITLILFMIPFCRAIGQNDNSQIFGGEFPEGIRIAWDHSSIQKIADKGSYPRLLRLKDSSVVVMYEDREGNIAYKRSYDNGISWGEANAIFERFQFTNSKKETVRVNIANPEIIQLHNGDIIVGCNYRPRQNEIAPYSIVIRRSTDNGKTWQEPQVLYNAAPRFKDGCWEPAFLQLPGGELQVYFANENPYQHSDEQEISMLSSSDNGKTWTTTPKTVSFRKDRRDGMPVPVIVNDEIVVVIEDNNIDRFKPYTVRTKIADNWAAPVLGNSTQRDYALTEKIADSDYLGAPYLIKLATGETVISYQTNENRDPDWELSTMEVAIGDKTARNFAKRTQPFDVALDKEAKWNSLALWDDHTIVALASTNYASEHVAPHIIKGYIITEITADKNTVNDFPVFIGSKGNTNLWAGIANDAETLYIKCKVKDETLYPLVTNNNTTSDGVYIYIASGSSKTGVYKFWCDYKGNTLYKENANGQWTETNNKSLSATASENNEGYELTFEIPLELLSLSDSKEIRLNIALSAYDNEHSGYIEPVVNSSLDEVGSWLKIRLN